MPQTLAGQPPRLVQLAYDLEAQGLDKSTEPLTSTKMPNRQTGRGKTEIEDVARRQDRMAGARTRRGAIHRDRRAARRKASGHLGNVSQDEFTADGLVAAPQPKRHTMAAINLWKGWL